MKHPKEETMTQRPCLSLAVAHGKKLKLPFDNNCQPHDGPLEEQIPKDKTPSTLNEEQKILLKPDDKPF